MCCCRRRRLCDVVWPRMFTFYLIISNCRQVTHTQTTNATQRVSVVCCRCVLGVLRRATTQRGVAPSDALRCVVCVNNYICRLRCSQTCPGVQCVCVWVLLALLKCPRDFCLHSPQYNGRWRLCARDS